MAGESEIAWAGAAELAALYRAKQLSPVEATEALLGRIGRIDPKVNAFARTTPEHALAAARAAEARYARGEPLGSLDGVPMTVKDLHATAGVPTEFGSHAMAGNVPKVDSPAIGRLHAAGCVMLGKTTSPEFGWKGVSQSPLTGITHNPWGHGLNAGASSAGAAVAAACGMGVLHDGGDGAGSIRMPAHFCGVYGLKPTHGRIPNWPMSNNDLATHLGPITRSVADAALMLKAMAGPHPWDITSLEAPPADYPALLRADMRGKRIAWSPDLGHARVEPEVAALAAKAARAFEEMGAIVEQVTPEWGPRGPDLVRYFWPAAFASRARYLEKFEAQMDPGFVAVLKASEGMTVRDFMAMREQRWAYVQAIHEFMEGYDFLLTPAVSVAAFPAERLVPQGWPEHEWDWLVWAEFSYPFNWSGSPAASIPCGFTSAGLPVGLQIVGRRFDDLGVLQASAAFEAARPWAQLRPPVAT